MVKTLYLAERIYGKNIANRIRVEFAVSLSKLNVIAPIGDRNCVGDKFFPEFLR